MTWVRRFEIISGRLGTVCHRRPWTTLAIASMAAVASFHASRGLKLDTDLVALLPRSFPSVEGLEVLQKRFGAVGQGRDPGARPRHGEARAVRG